MNLSASICREFLSLSVCLVLLILESQVSLFPGLYALDFRDFRFRFLKTVIIGQPLPPLHHRVGQGHKGGWNHRMLFLHIYPTYIRRTQLYILIYIVYT